MRNSLLDARISSRYLREIRPLSAAVRQVPLNEPLVSRYNRISRRIMLKEGDQAPEFTSKDQDGNEVSLKDLRGKRVVLWFYPKDDTPG